MARNIAALGLPQWAGLATLSILGCLMSCGGGGSGSPNYAISLSPASLSFEADQGDSLPSAHTVDIAYNGDGLIVGYPAGSTAPDWLNMQLTGTSSPAHLLVTPVSTSLAPGEHDATIRVLTGKADGSIYTYKDMPVRYTIYAGLSASVTSLAYSGFAGQPVAGQSFTIQTGRPGFSWKLEATSPNGTTLDWLAISRTAGTCTGTTDTIDVQVNPKAAGTYTASLKVYDAKTHWGTTIPVVYQVKSFHTLTLPGDFSLTESSPSSALVSTGTLAQVPEAPTGLPAWQLTSDQSWLRVSPTSGSLTNPTALTLTLDPEALWALPNGQHTAHLILQFPDTSLNPIQVPLLLNLALNPALSITAPQAFRVSRTTTSAALTQHLSVKTNLGSAFARDVTWAATSGISWLVPTPNGSVLAGTPLTLALQAEELPGEPTDILATVSLQPTDTRFGSASLDIPVNIQLPTVRHIAPSCTWTGQDQNIIIRGTGFLDGPTIPVTIGASQVTGILVSPTEVHAKAPAQASTGPLPVSIPNALGIDRGSVNCQVLPHPAYAYADFPIPNVSQVTQDPQRQAVLVAAGDRLIRFRYLADPGWLREEFPMPNIQGTAVSLDGSAILAFQDTFYAPVTISHLDPETLALISSQSFDPAYAIFGFAAIFNNGETLLLDTNQWCDGLWYPQMKSGPRSFSFGAYQTTRRDGSLVVLGSQGISPQAAPQILRADANAYEDVPLPSGVTYGRTTMNSSGDGNRFVAGTWVADQTFGELGTLVMPERNILGHALSPDGHYLYTFTSCLGSPSLLRTDLSAPAGPYLPDTTPLAFPFPEPSTTFQPWTLSISEDGSTLFVTALLFPPGLSPSCHFYAFPLPSPQDSN